GRGDQNPYLLPFDQRVDHRSLEVLQHIVVEYQLTVLKGVRKPRTHRFGQRDRLVWRIDDNGHVFSMTDDRHDLLDLFPGAPVVYDAYLFDGVGLIHVGDSPVGQEVFEIIVIHASGEARYVYDRIYQAQKAVEVGMSLEYTR